MIAALGRILAAIVMLLAMPAAAFLGSVVFMAAWLKIVFDYARKPDPGLG